MKIEKKKIKDLVDNPKNVRIHTDKQISEFAKSIEMFGVVRPIVIDENNMILVGHGLKKALESLGKKEADVLKVTGLTETEKNKLLLSDNKIYQLGVDDYDAIDELIKEIQDFEIPGYDAENLEMLYGQSSIADDYAEFKQNEDEVKKRIEKQETFKESIEDGIIVPERIQIAREEQKSIKFVLCPHCGGKVYVD